MKNPTATSRRVPYCHLETLEPRIAPATFVVNSLDDVPDGPGYEGTLRWAIAQSELNGPGKDTIIFDSTVFNYGTITLTQGELPTITGDLVIKGLGADRVVIDAAGASRIFNINDGNVDIVRTVSITGLTLTGGFTADQGGAIFNAESLNLSNSVVTANVANAGAGIYSNTTGGHLIINNSVITGNNAGLSGGGIQALSETGKIQIKGSMISDNTAQGGGGALLFSLGGKISIDQTSFVSNEAYRGGGLSLYLPGDQASASIKNSDFNDNFAYQRGGGFYIASNVAKVQLQSIVVTNNLAGDGGGAFINGTADTILTLKNGDFHNNTAKGDPAVSRGSGGGLYLDGVGSAKITGTLFSGNRAEGTYLPPPDGFYIGGQGGGLQTAFTSLSMQSSTFAGNFAFYSGGGAAFNDSNATLKSTTFAGNIAAGSTYAYGGGAMATNSVFHVSKSLFAGNTASHVGGGIHIQNSDESIITSSAFAGNTAVFGGAVNFNGSFQDVLAISKSSFEANTATKDGGAIRSELGASGAVLEISGSTFTGNLADEGGGAVSALTAAGSEFLLSKTTLKNNTAFSQGGALEILGKGAVEISKTTISGNVAFGPGGGIYSNITGAGTIDVSKSSITGNLSKTLGGGIYNSINDLTLSKTTVSGNLAAGDSSMTYANKYGNFSGYTAAQTKTQKGSLVVNSTLDDGSPGTLRWAIEEANAGNAGKSPSIVFDPTMKGTIALTSDLPVIETKIAIRGNGVDHVAIDGGGNFQIFNFNDGTDKAQKVSVSGLSLIGGFTPGDGGAIFNYNELLTVNNVFFYGNYAGDDGGAIYTDRGKSMIQNSLFAGNIAADEGGAFAIWTDSSATVKNTMVSGNLSGAEGGGGWMRAFGQPKTRMDVSGSVFTGNSAGFSGGGLHLSTGSSDGAKFSLKDLTLVGNEAGDEGGGLYVDDSTDSGIKTSIKGTLVANNSANQGGGMSLYGEYNGIFTVSKSSVLNNSAMAGSGGGIALSGYNPEGLMVNFKSLTIAGNSASGFGGGVFVGEGASGTLSKVTIAGNESGSDGGGIAVRGNGGGTPAFALVSASSLLGNTAGGSGGGALVVNESQIVIQKSTVSGNTASSGGGVGGQIDSSISISKSAFLGNYAMSSGGAVSNGQGSLTEISKSTFTGNHAFNLGGALYIDQVGGQISIASSTIQANSAAFGGGLITSITPPGSANFTALALLRNAAGTNIGGAYLGGVGGEHSMSKVQVLQNTAATDTGGIGLQNDSKLEITKSIISANVAGSKAGGIFDFNADPGNLIINTKTTTLSGNFAPTGPNYYGPF